MCVVVEEDGYNLIWMVPYYYSISVIVSTLLAVRDKLALALYPLHCTCVQPPSMVLLFSLGSVGIYTFVREYEHQPLFPD